MSQKQSKKSKEIKVQGKYFNYHISKVTTVTAEPHASLYCLHLSEVIRDKANLKWRSKMGLEEPKKENNQ